MCCCSTAKTTVIGRVEITLVNHADPTRIAKRVAELLLGRSSPRPTLDETARRKRTEMFV